MTQDKNKGIEIMYNHLNLPETIKKNDQTMGYTYDATGVKHQKIFGATNIEYTPTAVYKNNALELVFTPEGYFEQENGRFVHTYQYKDHLGNNRLSYADSNDNGKIDTPGSTAVTIWEDGFEDKSTANGDWNGSGNSWGWPITDIVSNKAKSGTKAGHISLDNVPEPAKGIKGRSCHSNEWTTINISKPTLFRVSAWVYAEPELYRTRMYLFMKTATETGYESAIAEHFETRKGKWVYMEKVVLVQPEIDKLNIRIDADTYRNRGGNAWFDDLKIEQLDMSQNEIVSETNYYPFGLAHKGYNEHKNSSNFGENYKFNGVELNNDMDLGLYEMDFRQYNPTIGRFTGIDALSEERYWVSNYNFGQNNPIMRVDPTGLLDDYGIDQNGRIELIKKTDDETDTLYSVTRNDNGDLAKDENGNVIKNDTNGDGQVADGDSVTVDKGLLNNVENTTFTESNGTSHNLQIMDVSQGNSADIKSIFEFSANNSSSEFSFQSYANGNKFISTSFLPNAELSATSLIKQNGNLIYHIHSHPNYDDAPSPGDINSAKVLNKLGFKTRLEIYNPGNRTYRKYNRNSVSYELNEVIVRPRK